MTHNQCWAYFIFFMQTLVWRFINKKKKTCCDDTLGIPSMSQSQSNLFCTSKEILKINNKMIYFGDYLCFHVDYAS